MKITKKWIKEKEACGSGFDWWTENGTESVRETVDKLIAEDKFDWANWLLTNIFAKEQNIKYAVFSARSVLKIYEDKFPDDLRPRKAIEAAEQYLQKPTAAAGAAAWNAAGAAARDARDAAGAAAWAAAWNAAGAAAFKKMQEKIIDYGLSLLEDA